RRKEELEVPSNALREACLNAFTHRAWQFDNLQVNIAIYDNRVEIENPGRFPADINPNALERSEEENKKNTSQPQNEIIANVLYLTGTTEHWGRGLALMYDECDRTGVERPRYFNTENFVRIVFRRPDMSKWTHDGFVKDTVATENDTVATENDTVATENDTAATENDTADSENDTADSENDTADSENDTVAVENGTVKRNNGTLPSENGTVEVKPRILRFIKLFGENWLSAIQIQCLLGLKSKSAVIRTYIKPSLEKRLIMLEQPNSPNAPNQRYGLTDKGKSLYYRKEDDKD
ncbi:ATP-binding protein, partial [Bacteroides caecimuris]|uniref:ATP-binding protein n=1 Tax=Bacteroides caecimuris TaxID=1796613 RepID=UPI00272C46CC